MRSPGIEGELDCIELRGLRCVAAHGVLPEERERPQPFEVDLWVWADLAAAGASDDLADTLDYGGLAGVVVAAMNDGHAALLEHLAERVAGAVLRFGSVEGGAVASGGAAAGGAVASGGAGGGGAVGGGGGAAPRAVTVTVRKLRPPLPFDVASSAVTLTRHAGA